MHCLAPGPRLISIWEGWDSGWSSKSVRFTQEIRVAPAPSSMLSAQLEEHAEGKMSSKTSDFKMTLEMFVRKMLPLIELEKEAEIAASKESLAVISVDAGSALRNLKCVNVEAGLLGKTLLELQPNTGDSIPSHKLGPHDVVILKPNKADSAAAPLGQGVVYRIKDKSVTVAVDDVPEDGLNSTLRLEKVANEVTYQRLKSTLVDLSKGLQKGPAAELVPVLFGDKDPTFSKTAIAFDPYNRCLDHSQMAAVRMAVSSNDVVLLHGPPGTGKTTAVVEIILQEVKRGSKVLACAASNIAVDNIVERLASYKVKMVRLGHPARLLPKVLDSALDAQVLEADNTALAKDIRKEINVLNRKVLKAKDRRTRGELRKELRKLTKEERQRQQKAVTNVIQSASVILTTLTGALSAQLQKVDFDVVIIDEAAQALEITCWIALLKGRRCVLAGDHLQLAPTVQSKEAEKQGLGKTLFERLAGLYASQAMTMLTVQYRMHHLIMDWSSYEIYDGKIEAHETVAKHTLCELEGVIRSPATEHTLVLIDISGCDMEESKDETDSTFNEGEARVAITHAKKLVESGVKASDIGIITPYAAQVNVLRTMRSEQEQLSPLEISTVDGFQGREKEAIIISMVRSNTQGEVGFLIDNRRMNVAVTRAKRQCCLVCDSGTVGNNAFLKRTLRRTESIVMPCTIDSTIPKTGRQCESNVCSICQNVLDLSKLRLCSLHNNAKVVVAAPRSPSAGGIFDSDSHSECSTLAMLVFSVKTLKRAAAMEIFVPHTLAFLSIFARLY